MIFNVNINNELLVEFVEQIEENKQAIDILAIKLNKFPNHMPFLHELGDHFTELMYSSVKLDLTPITESLADTIIAIDKLIEFSFYPARMTDFLLMVVDRLLLLARDIESHQGIDICKSQHILVSLQYIILIKDSKLLEDGIHKAITSLLQTETNIETGACVNIDSDIILFTNNDTPSVKMNDLSDNKRVNFDGFVSRNNKNPLLQAREACDMFLANHPINLLVTIIDQFEQGDISHTRFLLEMAVAINAIAGDIIDHENLMLAISIHDFALASTPDIMNKPSLLSVSELEIIRQHPTLAYEFASYMNFPNEACEIVLQHHEHVDGQGYPNGIKGQHISEGAKLLSIVDAFHSMTEIRPYSKYPMSILSSLTEINACADTQFDRQWVVVFNKFIKEYWLPARQLIA